MTRASAQQVYKVNLPQFHRYLRDKGAEIGSCIGAVEAIHSHYQAVFAQELETWQELFRFCYPQLTLQRKDMPPALQEYLDRIEAEELARLKAEMEALEKRLGELRTKMDGDMAHAQATTKELLQANPKLNQREERLKRTIVQLQDEYAQAFERAEALRRPALGWLTNAGAIFQAQRLQKSIKEKQAKAMVEQRQVRQKWLDEVNEASETQSQLRTSWQAAGMEATESQARYDHLVNNLDDLARQEGLQRALQEITQVYPVKRELGEKLAEIAKHNAIRTDYEKGLGASSETLGLLRGIAQGLTKFGDSVEKVLAQQRQYNLKQIEIPLPHDVGVVNQTWKQLEERLQDRTRMNANPLEFAEIASQYVTSRLTATVIQRFFEQMGAALNRGTAAWD